MTLDATPPAEWARSTGPKPFVFVIMPFAESFDDIYEFGIVGAAEDAGAYAERVDHQVFQEGILDRTFNQISKADVIVADMTGRSPNVFYEVGYAHALNKVVILLTQDADDIPFDLRHQQHLIYAGKIGLLRNQLAERIRWGIALANDRSHQDGERFTVMAQGKQLPASSRGRMPQVFGAAKRFDGAVQLRIAVQNQSFETSPPLSHLYLFSAQNPALVPAVWTEIDVESGREVTAGSSMRGGRLRSVRPVESSAVEGYPLQYRLPLQIPPIPPQAVDEASIICQLAQGVDSATEEFVLRIHGKYGVHDFGFAFDVTRREPV